MNLSDYSLLLKSARRFSRNVSEADDLLQEALLVGIREGRLNSDSERDRAWLVGVIKNLATSTARSAARRKKREQSWAGDKQESTAGERSHSADSETILNSLSEATRRVAVLALHGMNADEICYVLELKPAAFRQRLTSLRKTLGALPQPLRAEALAMAYAQPRRQDGDRLDFGLIRRALLHHVQGKDAIGTHDPDGHLVGIRTR